MIIIKTPDTDQSEILTHLLGINIRSKQMFDLYCLIHHTKYYMYDIIYKFQVSNE